MKKSRLMKLLLFMIGMALLLTAVSPAQAITVSGGFGPGGEAGQADYDGDTYSDFPITLFGAETSEGDVLQLDAFLYLDSDGGGTSEGSLDDLNGSFDGITAELGVESDRLNVLAYGITSGFSYNLFDANNLYLTYTFTNNTGGTLSDLRFFSYLDAEIDEPSNTYFNEYGGTVGTLGSGSGDGDPDNWEIDDPYGNILAYNLYDGLLDNTNGVPFTDPNDVAMALGFYLGTLNPLDVATITMLISTSTDGLLTGGSYLGSYALRHFDNTSTDKSITFSGQSSVVSPGPAPVPEPGTMLLMGTGIGIMSLAALRFRLRRKSK